MADKYTNPMNNPNANADIAKILSPDSAGGPKPMVALPADPAVRLPGGLVRGMDLLDVQYDAEVRELTGAHEEAITRARQSSRIVLFTDAILQAGVVSVGGEPMTKDLLGDLLIGDADYLLREIRRATYGDELEFKDLVCPSCNEQYDLVLTLDDIPVRKLDSSSDRVFEIALRKGKSAVVRLPTNSDREKISSSSNLNSAEQNTLLLSRCVMTITDNKGEVTQVATQQGPVKALSIPDRQTILKEITERQPGPQFDNITYAHACGEEVHFGLSIGDLFLGL